MFDMSFVDVFQVFFYFAVLIALTPLLGSYCAMVLDSDKHMMTPVLGRLERGIYRLCGISKTKSMDWKQYAWALLGFNFLGFLAVMALQMTQQWVGLNPDHMPNVSWHLAFNTAASFVTNTNWQSYAGETTMSYATQMFGLTVQNFLSAATGISVLLVFVRGIRQKTTHLLGNFWVDIVRSTVYLLLPLSIVAALYLGSQGVVQTMAPAHHIQTLEGKAQVIAVGPVASQEAIKQLGTNGGGFFNVNSAHPYENPTPGTNFVEMLLILLLPSSLVYAFGRMVGSKRHAWVVWGVMFLILMVSLSVSLYSEFHTLPFEKMAMEGKEVRLGVTNSVLWSVVTTAASSGSVNAMISSLSPLAGGLALFNIMLGEIVFGGVGSGMYGMLLFILLTVFLAGLMVGRTPEYLSKKIESREMKWVIVAILIPNLVILIGAGVSAVLPIALSSLAHTGPHGLSEILYAFSSSAGNNGSAFAGLSANVPYYNVALGIAMILGRFGVIIPCLAIAGSLSQKKITPPSSGTFPTDTLMFGGLLIGTILIVGVLTFLPALTLGPVVDHLLLLQHRFF